MVGEPENGMAFVSTSPDVKGSFCTNVPETNVTVAVHDDMMQDFDAAVNSISDNAELIL